MQKTIRVLTVAAFIAAIGFIQPARADAIDGEWCRKDGKHMNIQGPAIVTPGGHKITGDYDRHAFSYIIPPGEPGTGTKVSIQLLGEHLAHAREGADPTVQEWRRCQPVS